MYIRSARELHNHNKIGEAMLAQVKKWGNSQGIMLSKQLLKESQIQVGDSVELLARRGQVIIKATKADPRGRYDLKDLMAKVPKNYKPEEVGFGVPVGGEAW